LALTQSDHPGYGGVPPTPARMPIRWPLIAVAVALLLLLGGAFAAYAYDDSRKDEIAEGITIGGVDVGGLTEDEARRLLQAELIAPLRKPLEVSFRKRTYTLSGKQLRVHADIDGAIDEAIEQSQEGGLPGRLVRYLSGGTVDERISPQVGYSQPAINRFVRRIAGDIDREPVDATVTPSPSSLEVVPAEPGRKVRDNLLTRQLNAAARRGSRRTLVARVHPIKPEVTTEEVASAYPVYLTLDRANFTLRLWTDLKLAEEYTVAVGTVGFETPTGVYNIQNKAVDPAWSVPEWGGALAGQVIPGGVPENPLKERWLGIYDGAGIHGTDATYSLGTAASHGCVRMSIPDVIELYDRVPIGTPIYIG
jgi:lipoprotein-anchoring transpeptidase ErfK/SrfK